MSTIALDGVMPRPALLTPQQVCGILNLDIRAVNKLGIRRVVLADREFRYDPADLEAFIQGRKEVIK